MSNDEPEDGKVESFRSRRRTRRGKRRSLRVPVDEVPRRSAADEVAALVEESSDIDDAPMPLHARISSAPPPASLDDIESEVTQPGSVPSPALLDDELAAAAAFASAPDTGEVESSGVQPAIASDAIDELGDEHDRDDDERDEVSDGDGHGHVDDDPREDTEEELARATSDAKNGGSASEQPAPLSAPAPPRSAPPPASRPPPALRASSSSMPVARAGGDVSPSYVPPPPGVPKNLDIPKSPELEPPPVESPKRATAPRRDSVIVRGTVRVSDMARPGGKAKEAAPDEKVEAQAPGAEPAEPIAPPVLDEVELEGFEDDDEDAIAGEKTLVRDRDAVEVSAATDRASTEQEVAAKDVAIAPSSDEEIAEDIDLDIEEEEAAGAEDDEAEELELAESEALEEIEGDVASDEAPVPPPPAPPAQVEPAQTASAKEAIPPPPEPKDAAVPDAKPAPEAVPDVPKRRRRKPWWEDFFNDDYLRTVRPHPLKYVRRQCDFIEAQLGLERGATILDVGCGLGLHAVELASRGYLVVGLDLSLPMLSRAADEAQDRGLKINFLHGDMREMTFDGAFDAVLCWGTTFGYFDEETNRKVIERLYRALKPMGLLLIDAVNRDHVVRTQPNLVWFEGDGCVCMEETQFNYITSRLEVKRTVILDDGRQRENVYSIRLYALNEIGQLLHHQGFRVAQVSGHDAHAGVFFGADSPRMIIMAERRLGKGTRDTKDGVARSEKPPSPPSNSEGQPASDEEEIAELDIEPE